MVNKSVDNQHLQFNREIWKGNKSLYPSDKKGKKSDKCRQQITITGYENNPVPSRSTHNL